MQDRAHQQPGGPLIQEELGLVGAADSTAGSLSPTFVSARTVALAVRLAYAIALLKLISDQLEPTIARLRYSLGGDRPSQTAHHARSWPWLRLS